MYSDFDKQSTDARLSGDPLCLLFLTRKIGKDFPLWFKFALSIVVIGGAYFIANYFKNDIPLVIKTYLFAVGFLYSFIYFFWMQSPKLDIFLDKYVEEKSRQSKPLTYKLPELSQFFSNFIPAVPHSPPRLNLA